MSEQFFEVDLPAILDLPGHNDGLFALDDAERRHCLKLFALVFRREAFLPGAVDERTFHQRAIEEGRFYEERVAANLSELVFGQVFPELARAIAAAAPEAPLLEVRESALILLYRLLFILYAEDRDLLPVRDERYDDYGLCDKVRGDIGDRKDRGDVFSEDAARHWSAVDDLCRAVDRGDAAIGLPPYNGGLFDRARILLLDRIRLGDRVMADVIDALSFEQDEAGRRRYINYRDLGVRQLGSIYERLLEHELVRDGDAVAVRPDIFARKGSGSYYTPDDLVGLIVEETVGPLVQARMDGFLEEVGRVPGAGHARERAVARLTERDPAEAILALKVCDPAMGSGHFLVSLADYLADSVIAAMAEAEVTRHRGLGLPAAGPGLPGRAGRPAVGAGGSEGGRGRYPGLEGAARPPAIPGGLRVAGGGPVIRGRGRLSGAHPVGGGPRGARPLADRGVGEPFRAGRPGLALPGRRTDAGGRGLADGAAAAAVSGGGGRAHRRAPASGRDADRQDRAGRARGAGPGDPGRSAARRRRPPGALRCRVGAADGDRRDDGSVGRPGRSGPSAKAGSVGEERELLMVLALNEANVASQREIAIAYWGLDEVAKHWEASYWMRAQVRYRLKVAREIAQERQGGG